MSRRSQSAGCQCRVSDLHWLAAPAAGLAAMLLALTPAAAGMETPLQAAEAQAPAVRPTSSARKPAPQAAAPEAISPRWIGPKWEIKGLTVWVFTPGHFEGR